MIATKNVSLTNNQDFHNFTLVLIFFNEWKNLVLRKHSHLKSQ